MIDTWVLYLPEPWYFQWWFLLPASSAVLGGLMGRLANRLSGSWMGGVCAWYLSTLFLAVYLFVPFKVMAYLIFLGFWTFWAALTWMGWRRKREAESWTG